MTTIKSRTAESDLHHIRESKIADLASRPIECARRLMAAEEALRKIESSSIQAIHEYGITQERPEKWVAIGDLVLKIMAPIRDAARQGLAR